MDQARRETTTNATITAPPKTWPESRFIMGHLRLATGSESKSRKIGRFSMFLPIQHRGSIRGFGTGGGTTHCFADCRTNRNFESAANWKRPLPKSNTLGRLALQLYCTMFRRSSQVIMQQGSATSRKHSLSIGRQRVFARHWSCSSEFSLALRRSHRPSMLRVTEINSTEQLAALRPICRICSANSSHVLPIARLAGTVLAIQQP